MTRLTLPIAALAAVLAGGPALAQVIPTGTPAADILLSRAIAEHRVFLTCSSLDGLAYPTLLANWKREVDAAVATLNANAVPPEAIAAFTAAAAPAALLPAPDTPFADVLQLCTTNSDWQTRYERQTYILLETMLPKAFE
jgi:hypothetical protein